MKMIIGDRVIQAEIMKRDEARRTYETAKREGYTAALLEQERPNVFTQSVANIEPGTDIDVVIRYVQNLTYDAGRYEFVFPMVVGPRFFPGNPTGTRSGTGYAPDTDSVPDASRISPPVLGGGMRSGHDISLEMVAEAVLPIKNWDVPTHDVRYLPTYDGSLALQLKESDSLPNRDFVLRYNVDGDQPRVAVLSHKGERGGFVTLIVQPPELDIDELVGNREIIFVVDVSGSMRGVPLAMCQDAMREAIRKLRPVDTFNVITFAGATRKAFARPRPANETNIREALNVVAGLRAGGGTMMANAVREALDPNVEDGRHRYVFFLTDGYVGNEREIFAGAERLVKAIERRGQRAKVFGYGVGSSVNRHLLDGLAKAGKGVTLYASTREDPTIPVNTFYRYIDHSILRDVEIDWGGLDIVEVYPAVTPDLFASHPLIVHARYNGAGSGTITVRGTTDHKTMELPVNVTLPEKEEKHEILATLWARAKIGSLERQLWNGHGSQAVEAITQLGIDFRIVTKYTSFVAVDRSKRVNGETRTIVQPIESPEGVDPVMAGAKMMRRKVAKSRAFFAPTTASPALAASPGYFGSAGASTPEMAPPPPSRTVYRSAKPRPARRGGGGRSAPRSSSKMDDVFNMPRAEAPRRAKPSDVSISQAQIRKVIVAHTREVKACYEMATKKKPGLSGRISIRWFITGRGVAIQIKVESSTVGSSDLEQCLVSRIKKWKFATHGGRAVRITFPFVFSGGR
ncbi:MAG: AgmX/PglI C-terminal domain-containing protein, partial [Myxococcota bacterium]